MKKFYLFCDNGMSTSLMAGRMQKVADEHKLPIEVKAFGQTQMDTIIEGENPDVILLGPQVKHIYEKTVEKFGHLGKPIMTIDSEDYGSMNGERVLKIAMLKLKEAQNK